MQYTPLNYSQINVAAGQYSPSPVKAYNNRSYWYWERALFQRAASVLKFNIPWSGGTKDFFLYCLFRYGYVAVFNTEDFGLAFQPCDLNGFNFYYQPTEAIVTNPRLSKTFIIGDDAELIKLTPDYYGVWDIIDYYACKLSDMDVAIDVSIINNKTPNILGAKNKSAAEALKKVCDKINKGEPTVVYDKIIETDEKDNDPFVSMQRDHIKESYITTDQLRDLQTILNDFDNEIGIPTIPYEKKERMVASEAESRIIDSQSRATVWLETINSSLELVNKMFNTNMSVALRYEVGGVENG